MEEVGEGVSVGVNVDGLNGVLVRVGVPVKVGEGIRVAVELAASLFGKNIL